jgi:hypothetical protein
MRPLLLHASSACAIPKSRRVIHMELPPQYSLRDWIGTTEFPLNGRISFSKSGKHGTRNMWFPHESRTFFAG